jgi:uncharacterized membrane protein YkoI
MKVAAVIVLLAGALLLARGTVLREDDVPVDPATPAARRAAATALEVVRGRVVEVARDRDNGKWEVTIDQDGRMYEVELEPGSLRLLRLDFD